MSDDSPAVNRLTVGPGDPPSSGSPFFLPLPPPPSESGQPSKPLFRTIGDRPFGCGRHAASIFSQHSAPITRWRRLPRGKPAGDLICGDFQGDLVALGIDGNRIAVLDSGDR